MITRRLCASLAVLTLLASPAAAQERPTALVGGTLVDGTGAPAVADAVVVYRDGRIVCAGPRAVCAVPATAEIVDASGGWIVPGLVDAHVHYSQTGWADGRPDSYDARDRFPYAATIAERRRNPDDYYRAYLCSGVTATFDVGGFPWTWGLRDDTERRADAPHVAAAGPLLSTRDHWLNTPAERQFIWIGSDSAADEGARYLVANRTDAIKVWFLVGERTRDADAYVARLMAAGQAAREAGIPLIVHATNLWGATRAVEAGAHLLVHGVADGPVDAAFLEGARAAGTIYTPTLVVGEGYRELRNRAFDAGKYGAGMACVDPATKAKAFLTDSLPNPPSAEQQAAALERARRGRELEAANVRAVHLAGIPVAMGTDAGNPLTLHGPSVFLEMEALQAAGLTPLEVLRSATLVGAMAMGRADDFGSLAAGKLADILIVDADPLADIANLRRVRAAVRSGVLHRREALEWR
ncbi:MAG: amidohydrolase family protein [Gemmatimonadota bacterium]